MKHALSDKGPLIFAATLFACFLVVGFSGSTRAHADPLDQMETFDSEELSITSAAVGFTASKISPTNAPSARAAVCTVETNPAKWLTSGTAPTTSLGLVWPVTTVAPYVVNGVNDVRRFRAISTTGTTKLECLYMR